MKRVGITGGIGCGKSTVVAEFQKLGILSFVADQVAADYYKDSQFLDEIRRLFGDSVFDNSGTIDKRALANIVFGDRQALAKLNNLVHPKVMQDFDVFCREHDDQPYVLFESAILYDYSFDRFMHSVIGVYLDLDERIRRLLLRDKASEAEIRARIANQLPAETILQRADYIVLNYEGNPRARQVAYIDKQLRQ